MISGRMRAELASDALLGAGNFVHRLRASRRCLDEPVLWLDRPWRAPTGRTSDVLTLDEIAAAADVYAAWFHAAGVRPRDAVGVYTTSAAEVFVQYVALTALGAIPTLVNPGLPRDAAAELLRRVRVVGVTTDERGRDLLRGAELGEARFLTTTSDVEGDERARLPERYPFRHAGDDPVLITHSSGTTGVPKAVLVQHRNFFHAVKYRLRLPLPEGTSRILSALPAPHNSAITMLMFALSAGIPIQILSSQRASDVLTAIESFRPTMVAGFSRTFAELCASDLSSYDLTSVALWWNSGDAAHEAHIKKLMRFGRHREASPEGPRMVRGSVFVDGLGSSEMGHSLFNNVHRPGNAVFGRCVGRPLEFVDAAVLSDDGDLLPPFEVGRLGVRSPTLTAGYWNDSSLTWRSQLSGYWLTGDLVYRDERGFFFQVDRVTDAIRTRHGALYSVQAEEALMRTLDDVADCTIIGVPAPRGDVDAWLLLQRRSDDAFDEAHWKARINAVLESNHMPPVARVLDTDDDDVVVGVTGKVKKAELRARYLEAARHGTAAE